MEEYTVAAFRSRTQVFKYEKLLKNAGIVGEVINTPREIAVGCGLSLKISNENYSEAKKIYDIYRPTGLVGFYTVRKDVSGSRIISARVSWTD